MGARPGEWEKGLSGSKGWECGGRKGSGPGWPDLWIDLGEEERFLDVGGDELLFAHDKRHIYIT